MRNKEKLFLKWFLDKILLIRLRGGEKWVLFSGYRKYDKRVIFFFVVLCRVDWNLVF